MLSVCVSAETNTHNGMSSSASMTSDEGAGSANPSSQDDSSGASKTPQDRSSGASKTSQDPSSGQSTSEDSEKLASEEQTDSQDLKLSELKVSEGTEVETFSSDDSEPESEEKKSEEAETPSGVKVTKGEHAARELVSTEVTYIKQLKLLHDIHSRAKNLYTFQPELLKQLKEIFRDVESLLQFHESLLIKFEECINTPEGYLRVCDIFLRPDVAPFLSLYKAFLCQYQVNEAALTRLFNSEKEFKDICDAVRTSSEFKLQECVGLYQAIYARVNRYGLIVDAIRKNLLPDSEHKATANRVHAIISSLLFSSEALLTEKTKFEEMNQLFLMFEGKISEPTPTTRFLKQGPIRKVSRRSEGRIQDRFLFLFSDRMILTEPQNAHGKYKIKRKEMKILTMEIIEDIDEEEVVQPNTIRIEATECVFDICFANATERTEWIAAIDSAVKKAKETLNATFKAPADSELGLKAPTWVRDEQSGMCMCCTAKFKVNNRRHHCRACGKIFCNDCSSHRYFLEYCKSKSRVCIVCYRKLSGNDSLPGPKIKEVKYKYNELKKDEVVRSYIFFQNKTVQWSSLNRVYAILMADGAIHLFEKRQDIAPIHVYVTIGFSVQDDGSDLPPVPVEGVAPKTVLSPPSRDPNGIFLTHQTNTSIAYYIQTDTPELKSKWTSALHTVIAQYSGT